MPNTLRLAIRRLVEEFVDGILRALRSASLEEIQGNARRSAEPVRPRAEGRVVPRPTRKPVGRPRKGSTANADAVLDELVEVVQKHPEGILSEDLRAALNVEKGPFRVVAAAAVEAELIRRAGEKRATTFHPLA